MMKPPPQYPLMHAELWESLLWLFNNFNKKRCLFMSVYIMLAFQANWGERCSSDGPEDWSLVPYKTKIWLFSILINESSYSMFCFECILHIAQFTFCKFIKHNSIKWQGQHILWHLKSTAIHQYHIDTGSSRKLILPNHNPTFLSLLFLIHNYLII